MDAREVSRRLALLARPETTVAEAERVMRELDADAARAVPWVYRFLHDAADAAEVHAAARVLARWCDGPLGPPLEKALRAMLREPGVADLSKLAAAAVLERMGSALPDTELRHVARDAQAMGRQALRAALMAADRPAAMVRLLDSVAVLPPERGLTLVDDLVALGDARAARILAPLTQVADGELAVSAVGGIDLMGLDECRPFVALAARHHPDGDVRRQAGLTAARLTPSWPRAPWTRLKAMCGGPERGVPSLALLAAACDAAGAAETWDVLTVVCDRALGLSDHGLAELLTPDELTALAARFAAGGAPLAPVTPPLASRILLDATARALTAGAAAPLGSLSWPLFVGAPPAPAAQLKAVLEG